MSARRGAGGRRRYEPDWRDIRRSRRRLSRVTLLVGALIFMLAIAGLISRGDDDAGPALVEQGETWRVEGADDEMVAVLVDRIIDGDTLDVLSGGVGFRVRLFGIDAAEAGAPCHREATERLEALAGASVLLLPDERLEDRNGRQLRYLFTPDGQSIDATLVAEGLAEAWREDGRFRDELVGLEGEARNAATGCLWDGG